MTVVAVSETLRPLYSNQRGDPEGGRGQHCDRSRPLVSGERERERERGKEAQSNIKKQLQN